MQVVSSYGAEIKIEYPDPPYAGALPGGVRCLNGDI